MTFNWSIFWVILMICIVATGWAFLSIRQADAQAPTPPPPVAASTTSATQALNTALQNAIQQTARAQDIQIDLLGIYKSIPPAILAYAQEQQQLAAEKDQWWARQNAGMQQLLDAARAQASKQ